MFGLSLGEILVLGVMALIVIGPKQLPELARNLGRFMNELKRATDGFTEDIKQQANLDFDLEKTLRLPDEAEDEQKPAPEKKDDSQA